MTPAFPPRRQELVQLLLLAQLQCFRAVADPLPLKPYAQGSLMRGLRTARRQPAFSREEGDNFGHSARLPVPRRGKGFLMLPADARVLSDGDLHVVPAPR